MIAQARRAGFALVLFCLVLVTGGGPPARAAEQAASHVVLVSFDGFRSDYAERWQLSNFLTMQELGSSSAGLVPAYPSKTFPNHYSIVTGLYPGRHGLVDNNFVDPGRGLAYRMSDRAAVEDPAFYGGTPLWQYVRQHGLRSASYFWVGSEAPITGSFPDYYRLYDGRVANEARIEQAVDWLRMPEGERPAFISLYFSLVDSASHDHGPLGAGTEQAAQEADRLLGMLREALDALPLRINLVVVSDHGMVAVPDTPEATIHLPLLLELESVAEIVYNQTQVLIYPHDPAQVPEMVARLQPQADGFRIYSSGNLPVDWHYGPHGNVPPLLLSAELGKVFSRNARAPGQYTRAVRGVHGYPASGVADLHGILYALGSDIRAGLRMDAVDNVHVFPLLCALLGLPVPAEIDGKAAVLAPFLR